MKLFFLTLLSIISLSFSAYALDKVVYTCIDGSRTFIVKQSADKSYSGLFQDFTGTPDTYTCNRTGRGYNFKCTKEDYIVTVRRSAQGTMVVDFELDGEFFPDSGYLFQLSCE